MMTEETTRAARTTCRWARRGYRVEGVPELLQPEAEWVCTREERRPLATGDCAGCRHWRAAVTRPAIHQACRTR